MTKIERTVRKDSRGTPVNLEPWFKMWNVEETPYKTEKEFLTDHVKGATMAVFESDEDPNVDGYGPNIGEDGQFYDRVIATHDRTLSAAYHFARFMEALGYPMDTSDDFRDTPARVALMYREFLSPEPVERTAFKSPWSNMVVLHRIPFNSLCAHHFLPFMGEVTLAYIPKQTILGLSKFPRIIAEVAGKPQTQEAFTHELEHEIMKATKSSDVAVVTNARHLCVELRGAKSTGMQTIVSAMNGSFRDDPKTREEFMSFTGFGR